MFRANENAKKLIEQLESNIDSKDTIVQLINKQRNYFDKNDHIWDSKLAFRLWRRLFLNMMKEDGFADEVKSYNSMIRNKSKKKLNSKKRTSERIDVDTILNDLAGALDRRENTHSEKYEWEKNTVVEVQRVLRSYVNYENDDTLPKALEGIEGILRGSNITHESLIRDLFDSISTTLGVVICGINYRTLDISKRKYAYEHALELATRCVSGKNSIEHILKTDIGFIEVSSADSISYYSFNEVSSTGIRLSLIRAWQVGTNRMFAYKGNINDILSAMNHIKNDAFYMGDDLLRELARRCAKNPQLIKHMKLKQNYKQ